MLYWRATLYFCYYFSHTSFFTGFVIEIYINLYVFFIVFFIKMLSYRVTIAVNYLFLRRSAMTTLTKLCFCNEGWCKLILKPSKLPNVWCIKVFTWKYHWKFNKQTLEKDRCVTIDKLKNIVFSSQSLNRPLFTNLLIKILNDTITLPKNSI